MPLPKCNIPPKADMSHTTLSAFLDIEETNLALVDRSTLEMYATCPAQARLIETHRAPASEIAAVGEEVHKAFGNAVDEYVRSGSSLNPREIAETLSGYLYSSRPDVQPDVFRAARSSIYSWSYFIATLHGANILRYDGGEGDRSGQVAMDMEDLGVRVTSEIDLLHAGPSTELLHEIDYKSGHKFYSAGDVIDSFQFGLHAVLVFHNYPTVNGLEVKVWNTRINRLSYSVEFRREDLPRLLTRVRTAASSYKQHRNMLPQFAPTWPSSEKCERCDAAAQCPASGQAIFEVNKDPGAFVLQMVAVDQQLAAMKKLASEYVEKTGQDIVAETGDCFGSDKPKERKKTKDLYYRINREPKTEGQASERKSKSKGRTKGDADKTGAAITE